MRKIELKRDEIGIERIFLNGRFLFNLGVLDQGFWPDGGYTAPTDAALKFDIQVLKEMGFNTIRKHVKVEPDRWYYYCDTLGMLVWQDMVPPATRSGEAREEFEEEIKNNLAQLHNHPSITMWVLFNEGWNAYDQERLAHWMKQLDPSRLVNAHSGANAPYLSEWLRHLDDPELIMNLDADYGPAATAASDALRDGVREASWAGGDMTDTHEYPNPELPKIDRDKALVLGEYGGLGAYIEGHVWNDLAPGGSYLPLSLQETTGRYTRMAEKLKELEAQGLSGSIYTQITDVEQEQNGLMTYDRAEARIPIAAVARANSELVPRPGDQRAVVHRVHLGTPDPTPELRRYSQLLSEYDAGKRDLAFIKELALMALRQRDQSRATELGNEFIERLSRPYSNDTWAFIAAVTKTERDLGFDILRTQGQQADAMLGENVAEQTVREVIERQEIPPYGSPAPDWPALETRLSQRYGVLGVETVQGAEMMHYLGMKDWEHFGEHYAAYFATAARRSKYPIDILSYLIYEHVTDQKTLQAALRTVKQNILNTAGSLDRGDATELDTYANLLYKTGNAAEARRWDEKALEFSDGRDDEIASNLQKMQRGEPTWSGP
jgi:hypothetical protein